MHWSDVRALHPDRWLVVEALESHSENDLRVFDRVLVVDVCRNGNAALKRCAELRRAWPHRTLCFVHTTSTELKFEEHLWLAIRSKAPVPAPINVHEEVTLRLARV
jgi:hypothetical protein